MKSSALFSVILGFALCILSCPIGVAEQETAKQPPFAENWRIMAILGNAVQIWDYLGNIHYKLEGENLEGVDIVDVSPETSLIQLRDAKTGREKTVSLDHGTPGIISGEAMGLDTKLKEISFEKRRLKQLLNLLSKAAKQNFITTAAVPDVPVTGKLTNVTMRELLDTVLGGYGLAWKESDDGDFIKIMTEKEKAKEDQWVWETVECEVLAPAVVVQEFLYLLEPGERLEARPEKACVAILATAPRRAKLTTEIRYLEEKTRDWLGDQPGGITEAIPGLQAQIPIFEVDNRPLGEIMTLLGRFSGLNYIVYPTVRGIPVTAKLQGVTVREILDVMLPPHGCRWEPTGNLKSIRVLPASQPIVGKRPDRGSFSGPSKRTSPPHIEPATQEITDLLPELKTVIPELEFEDQPVAETLSYLSKQSGLNFFGLGAFPDRKLSARLHGLTVREILDALLPEYGCRWDVDTESHGIVFGGYHEGPPRVLPAK